MLSLTKKQWHVRRSDSESPSCAKDSIDALRRERRLTSPPLNDPLALPNIQKAAARIEHAIATQETIGIFGDYDCDGITATALLVRALRRRGVEPWVRLPHRVHDGYGLSQAAVEAAHDAGVTLLLTVDNGITAVDAAQQCRTRGIDLVITDHHTPGQKLPDAYAIVHPALDSQYPTPHPAGAGVAFDLVRALEQGPWQEQAIDTALAMTGTIADVVPLTGHNRTLVQEGLRALSTLHGSPLSDLLQEAGIDPHRATSTDIGFRLAPRINAAGRIGDPHQALKALLEGGESIQELSLLNRERQDQTDTMMQSLLRTLDTSSPLLWSASSDYHEGIVGLLAGKLTSDFGKPSMVVCIRGETCTASLRSPAHYNVVDALRSIPELDGHCGGHAQAAGCTFATSDLQTIVDQLSLHIEHNVQAADLVPTISIDGVLTTNDVTLEFLSALKSLEPFGAANSEPCFLLRNVTLENTRTVGSDHSHLQCTIAGKKCIGFRLGALLPHTQSPLDIVCRLGVDRWNGYEQVQIFVDDLRVACTDSVNDRQSSHV